MRAIPTDPGPRLRRFLSALLIVAAFCCLGTAPASAQDEAQMEGADGAALQVHPEAARLQALALIADGDYLAAGRYLQNYLRGNPDDKEAWLIQASVFENIKRYDLAEKSLQRSGEIRGVFLARARVAFAQNKIAEAMSAAQESLRRYPDFADAHHFMGYLHVTQKQYEPAVEELQLAARYGTSKVAPNAYYLGQALFHLGRYDEAEESLRVAQDEGEGTGYEKAAADFLDIINLKRNPAEAPAAVAAPAPKPAAAGGKAPKNWSAYAQLLFEYDTNVELLPDSEPALVTNNFGKTYSFRNALALGGDFPIAKSGGAEFRGTADANVVVHYTSNAEDAQVVALQGGGYANIKADRGVIAPFLLGRYTMFGIFGTPKDLDGDTIVDQFELGFNDPFNMELEPGLRYLLDHRGGSMLATLSYTLSRFTDQAPGGGIPQSARDSHTYRLTVGDTWTLGFMNRGDLKVTGRLRGGLRFAEDQDYSFWAVEPSVRAEWRVREFWIVEGSARYRYEDHYKSPVIAASIMPGNIARRDQTIALILNTRFRVVRQTDWSLWLVGQYLLEVNYSTSDGKKQTGTPTPAFVPDLQYDKHVVSLGIRATF